MTLQDAAKKAFEEGAIIKEDRYACYVMYHSGLNVLCWATPLIVRCPHSTTRTRKFVFDRTKTWFGMKSKVQVVSITPETFGMDWEVVDPDSYESRE